MVNNECKCDQYLMYWLAKHSQWYIPQGEDAKSQTWKVFLFITIGFPMQILLVDGVFIHQGCAILWDLRPYSDIAIYGNIGILQKFKKEFLFYKYIEIYLLYWHISSGG